MDMTDRRAAREALRAHQARTRRGLWALVVMVAALTVASVWSKVAILGVVALLLLFSGAFWAARRHLLGQQMRFRADMR